MLHHTIKSRRGRLTAGILGSFLYAAGVNWFIVPLDLYTGGLLGACQLLRTLLQKWLESSPAFDVSGLLYFAVNIPIFLAAYRLLGKDFFQNALVCTFTSTLFLSLLPVPSAPLVHDTLAGCLLGGILTGLGGGIMLTNGCSSGGLEVIGLCLSKLGIRFTMGKFNLLFNAALYALCALFFDLPTMIYSIICTAFTAIMLDKAHQQSINVQVFIFTKFHEMEITGYITSHLHRGVTSWEGIGGYTREEVHVICACLNKYEINELRDVILSIDPHAFLTIQEGVGVTGNFQRRFS